MKHSNPQTSPELTEKLPESNQIAENSPAPSDEQTAPIPIENSGDAPKETTLNAQAVRLAVTPKQPAPTVSPVSEELTLTFARYVKNHQKAYKDALPGADTQLDNPSQAWVNAPSIAPEEMSLDSTLDAAHLDAMFRILIASRPHLVNVGIFPVFNQDALENVARDAIYNAIKADPKYKDMLPNTDPLPEKSSLTDRKALKKRDKEEDKRIAQEKALQAEAEKVFHNLKISVLGCHLGMANLADFNLLGHPSNPDLQFDQCEQWIIPFRANNNHYTVAVVNAVTVDDQKIAFIKYYDSLNGRIDSNHKLKIEQLFQSKGFETAYQCVSTQDQRYGDNNCGIFACLKAIDIASENAGNPERIVATFRENYDSAITGFRVQFANIFQDRGYAVKIDDELKNAYAQQSEKFAQESVSQNRVDEIYRIMQQQIDKLQTTEQDKTALESKAPTHPLTPLEVNQRFTKLVAYGEKIKRDLYALRHKSDSNDEDKVEIDRLVAILAAYEGAEREIRVKLQAARLGENLTLLDKFLSLSWKKTFLALVGLGVGVYFGIPLLISLTLPFVQFALTYLPLNPLMTIIGGAFAFTAGIEVIQYFSQEQPAPSTRVRPQAAAPAFRPEFIAPPPLLVNYKRKQTMPTEAGAIEAQASTLAVEGVKNNV